MIPVAGSAYTYSYATMGELVAWIIGWDLVLEYAVGAATVVDRVERILQPRARMVRAATYRTSGDIRRSRSCDPAVCGSAINGIMNIPAVFILAAAHRCC